MHALDVQGIEQAERVVGQQVDRVRAVGRVRAAMAAAVVTQDAVALGERLHLRVPHLQPRAERVAEHDDRRICPPAELVVELDTVGVDFGHGFSPHSALLAPDARTRSTKSAASPV